VPLIEALIDSGPLVAFYNEDDSWHLVARKFFEGFKGKLITTEPVATEVMYLLEADRRVQNECLSDLHEELFRIESLTVGDFKFIAELNEKYKSLPRDFADLSILAVSLRLKLTNVVSLDSDFDIYRSLGKKFTNFFPKWEKSAGSQHVPRDEHIVAHPSD
jgi:predicted nucleic acid-binding protein